jgi:hypothetical protein
MVVLLERNDALRSVRQLGGPLTLDAARIRAAEYAPDPSTRRAFYAIVARPVAGGADIELIRGTAR